MKISRLASWVGPAYVGTAISTWATIAVYLGITKPTPLLGSYALTWLAWAAAATPVAGALATVMLTLDVILLKLKLRALPTGGAAWRMAMLAPLPVAVVFHFHHPSLTAGMLGVALTILAPVAVAATSVRVALGQSIDNA